MKNLKMKMTFVLGMLLIFILCSTCFAFDKIKDIEDTDYEVPVYALNELEILSHYPDGTYEPEGLINRAELIVKILCADGMLTDFKLKDDDLTGFSDIDNIKHWSRGYIYFALHREIIDMTEDKKFNPDDNATYADAITCCLRILGYKDEIESKGQYPENYINKAYGVRILKGLSIDSFDEPITRGNLAILLWNVMNTKKWEKNDNGSYSLSEKTLLEIKFPKKVSAVKKLVSELNEKTENEDTLPQSISFKKTKARVCLGCNGVDTKLTCPVSVGLILTPEDANEDYITWKSSDTSILDIEDGDMMIAKKKGQVVLTATTSNRLTATCDVEVSEHQLENNKYKYDNEYHWQFGVCNICLNDVDDFNREKHTFLNGKCVCGMKTLEETKQEESKKYEDVKSTDWYEKSVNYVTENKLMNGMGENKFSPNSSMTRGMLVTVLYRMSKDTYNGSSDFTDVSEGEYYASAIAWASKNEIVNGVGNNEFAPNAEVTREQLIVILYRYAKYEKMKIKVDGNSKLSNFEDYEDISEYSLTAFEWGYGKKIISGRTETTLNPKGTASRAEVATMLMRFESEK